MSLITNYVVKVKDFYDKSKFLELFNKTLTQKVNIVLKQLTSLVISIICFIFTE